MLPSVRSSFTHDLDAAKLLVSSTPAWSPSGASRPLVIVPMNRANALVIALLAIFLSACGEATPEQRIAAAKAYVAQNKHSAAIIELKNALQANPKSAEARMLLGVALLETGDEAGAEQELRRALLLGAPRNEVVPPLAQAMVGLGRFSELVKEFGDEDVGAPDRQADLATSLGQGHLYLKQPVEAERAFAKALALRPGYAPALLGGARLKMRAGDVDGALALIKSATEAAPKSITPLLYEAEILIAVRRFDDALAAYRNALQLQPKSLAANYGAISILTEQNKLEEAGKLLAVLKQVAPKHRSTHFAQANYEFRRHNVVSAREAIQRYLAIDAADVNGLFLAAAIEFEAKAYTQAEDYLIRAMARAPNAASPRRLLVASYLRSGKHREAMDALKPMLPYADKDPVTLALAGETYLRTGNAAKAEPMFKKASVLDPTDTRSRTGLGLSQVAQGRVDEGFRELEQAAANDPEGRGDIALFVSAMRKRDYVRALAAADALEKKQPNKPGPHNLRGLVFLAQKDVAGARKNFERALQIDPAFVPAAASLARIDMQEKNFSAAEKRFEAVLANNPKSGESLLALAEIKARRQGSPDEVIQLISRAITANPQLVAARLALINFHLRNKDPGKAVVAAQEAQSAIPDRPEILEASGRAFEQAKNPQQALAAYNRWARLQPASPLPPLRSASVHVASKDFAAAEASLRKSLEIKPDFADAQRALVALDVNRNRAPQALETARSAQKQNPKSAVGYILEGDVHASAKAWPEAVVAYRAGLKQVDSVDLAIRLHVALRAMKSDEADKFAAARLKTHANEPAFRVYLGESALAAREYPAALEHYKVLVAQHPDNAAYLNNLAFAAFRTNDPKALEYAERAAKLEPNNPAIMDTLGVMLVEKGDTARGVELLKKAVTSAPQAANIRLNLAKGLIKSGEKSAAKAELETLAQLGDKFAAREEVEKLLKTL